jgi:hypothetical protein
MNGLRPGDRVLYRDGDLFGVAKVDLVKDRHLTAFPFDTANRRWSRRNRRIAASFVIAKLPPREQADRIALRIERLRNEREAQRQIANRKFEESVRKLVTAETTSL